MNERGRGIALRGNKYFFFLKERKWVLRELKGEMRNEMGERECICECCGMMSHFFIGILYIW